MLCLPQFVRMALQLLQMRRVNRRLMFKAHVAPHVKIKAAGGIANLDDARDFIALGADRLGTSRIVKAVKAMED